MNRGGAREGSGRPSPWKHGETRTIRVPNILADQILSYARKLDSENSIDSDTISNRLSIIINEVLNDLTVTRNGKDKGAAKRVVNALVERLKAEDLISTLRH